MLLHLTTFIGAPTERVFDLSRSVNLHRASMTDYGEVAVDGRTSGLLQEGETVTWKARHLGKMRLLKVRLTSMKAPFFFCDEAVEGDFRSMKHEHYFKPVANGTIMIDQFYFEAPYGIFGRWFTALYLGKYLRRLLEARNDAIRKVAESGQWKQYLETT
jgi:ligand-binding SRPBCC domain-containing protein